MTSPMADTLTVRWSMGALTVEPGRVVGVGRDPANEIVLDSPVVSRRHARIQWADDTWEFADLGSTQGTFRDGAAVRRIAITGPIRLVLGQGPSAVELALDPPVAPPPDAAAPYVPNRAAQALAVSAGDVTVSLSPGQQCSIGRGSDNDLILGAPSVSRHHASIAFENGRWQLRDRGSSAGTWLDGQRGSEFVLTGRQTFILGDAASGGSLSTALGDAAVAESAAAELDPNRTVIRPDTASEPPSPPPDSRRRGR
jgi:pSer/pThr/pTyr-binding forkhead associated (FHA) protein